MNTRLANHRMANWKPELRLLRLSALLLGAILLAGCGEPEPPEKRVRQFVDTFETLAEAREWTEMVELIDGDYQDPRGNDKLKAAGILRAFFLRNKSVHIFTRIDEISFPAPDLAVVTVYVALARQPITQEAAANIPRTNMHKLTLELSENGDSYTVLSSEWNAAAAGNLVF